MVRPLGVGIIGCGQVTQVIHLPTLYSLPELFRVVHLADASSSVVSRVAPGNEARRTNDHLELLADPDVEVVLVATPDAYHPLHAIDACRAGKRAVLVEKPMALTPGEARAVARVSAETGTPVQVGTMHVYDPAFRTALPYMDSTPDLVMMEAILGPNDFNRDDAVQFVRGRPDIDDGEAGLGYLGAMLRMGGADAPSELFTPTMQLLGLSCHDFAPLRAIMGEPQAVEHLTLTPNSGYQLTLDYGGPKAVLTVYWHRTRLTSWKLRWLSPERQVEVRFPQSWGMSLPSEASIFELRDGMLREERLGSKYETGFREEWRHLHRVATEGIEPLTPASDAALDVALVGRIVGATATPPEKHRDPSGVLLLGAGNITATHAAVLDAMPDARVACVASRTLRSAERRAWRYECDASTFESIDQQLARSDIDVALVAGPPAVHADHTIRALRAGKHVIVEKPLCRTLVEADQIVAAAAEAGRGVAYAENYAFIPVIKDATSVIEDGAIGDVRSLHVYTLHTRPAHGDFLTPAWGGGALFDMGVHTLYWALMLAGFPTVVSVEATLESRTPDEADDYARVDLLRDRGMHAVVEVSWRETTARSGATVQGSAGSLEMTLTPRSHLVIKKAGGDEVSSREQGPRTAAGGYVGKFGYRDQNESFLAAFRESREPDPGVAEGRAMLELVTAAYASAATGEPVPLPYTGPRDKTPYEIWRGL